MSFSIGKFMGTPTVFLWVYQFECQCPVYDANAYNCCLLHFVETQHLWTQEIHRSVNNGRLGISLLRSESNRVYKKSQYWHDYVNCIFVFLSFLKTVYHLCWRTNKFFKSLSFCSVIDLVGPYICVALLLGPGRPKPMGWAHLCGPRPNRAQAQIGPNRSRLAQTAQVRLCTSKKLTYTFYLSLFSIKL